MRCSIVDIWLTIVWVVYFLVFVGTLAKRREPHIYGTTTLAEINALVATPSTF